MILDSEKVIHDLAMTCLKDVFAATSHSPSIGVSNKATPESIAKKTVKIYKELTVIIRECLQEQHGEIPD